MQHGLVDDRKWLTNQEYLEGLALAQLAPGPLAAQLAIYLGYILHGVVGATVPCASSCGVSQAAKSLVPVAGGRCSKEYVFR
jgi:chromate transport protein ChrA